MIASILTEQGQIAVPFEFRENLNLRPGTRFQWEQVSNQEFRVTVAPKKPLGAMAMLGYARVLFPDSPPRTTAEVMREIREGEDA